MDVLDWVKEYLKPETCTSDRFIYDDMDSQSGHSLPIIYQQFDAGKKSHWRDRGAVFDYLFSTLGEGKKLLDFGPGDGWPSLIVAPFTSEVIGVEGSLRRVAECTENAVRIGISNARFTYVAPGEQLPFKDNSFDGAMAASSVEQTLDPKRTLQELFRVLRPGGRLRIGYESLKGYRNGRERAAWLWQINDRKCRLILFDRDIDRELVVQYGLTYALSGQELRKIVSGDAAPISFDMITVPLLESTRSAIIDARLLTTVHPSGKTLVSWLHEIGFREVIASHDGIWAAGQLFQSLPEEHRPQTLERVDEYLRPIVKVVVGMQAPLDTDPMITAMK